MAYQKLDPGVFYGKVLRKHQGSGMILTEINHERARRLPKHTHELAYFSLLLSGGYREHFGTKEAVYKPMTIMFHPAAFEHHDEIADGGGRFFSVEIQPQWLDRLRAYTGSANISTRPHSGELAWAATRLYREYKKFDACSPLAIEGLLLEMLALAGRASLVKEDQSAPVWLARVIELLHAEFQQRLTLDYIASTVAINPFYLSRVFRKFQHESISRYANRLRVEFCCQQLIDPRLDLATIALNAGFSDQSHFTRIFKRATGFTPKGFRKLSARR